MIIGSGVLPTLRGVAAVVIWSLPMRVSLRGWLLLTLETLGRLMFINQCFIATIVIALRITMTVPGIRVEVVAEPVLGIVGATFALIIGIAHWSWVTYLQSITAHSQRKVYKASVASQKDLPGKSSPSLPGIFRDSVDSASTLHSRLHSSVDSAFSLVDEVREIDATFCDAEPHLYDSLEEEQQQVTLLSAIQVWF